MSPGLPEPGDRGNHMGAYFQRHNATAEGRAFWPALLPILGPNAPLRLGPGLPFFSYTRAHAQQSPLNPPPRLRWVTGVMEAPRTDGGYSYWHPSPTRVADPGTARPERSSRFCLGDQGVVCVSAESLNVVRRAQTTHRKIPCVGLDAPVAISIFFRCFFP